MRKLKGGEFALKKIYPRFFYSHCLFAHVQVNMVTENCAAIFYIDLRRNVKRAERGFA
jgi:hypothetical protein